MVGTVSPYRREAFRLLADAEHVEVIAWKDAGPPIAGLTVHRTTEVGAARLAGSGRYRAVISARNGRAALLGSYLAARARGVPFVLWVGIWTDPHTAAHALSVIPIRHLYRHADAVATYGRHVSRYVEGHRGARGGVFVAPQAVDVEYFGAAVPSERRSRARRRAGGMTSSCSCSSSGGWRARRACGCCSKPGATPTLVAAPALRWPARALSGSRPSERGRRPGAGLR